MLPSKGNYSALYNLHMISLKRGDRNFAENWIFSSWVNGAMKPKGRSIGALVIAVLSAVVPTAPATAIVGGSSALGNTAVVRLFNVDASTVCSGALWTSRIVVTAAHCVTDSSGQMTTGAIHVFAPGVNTLTSSQFVSQSAIVTVDGWIRITTTSQSDDIAFLVLPTEVVGGTISRIATTAEVDAFGHEGRLVRFLGYGKISFRGSSVTSPNYIDQKLFNSVSWPGAFTATQTDTTGICSGDSGGPVITQVDNEVVLIGINSAASGPCPASLRPSMTGFTPSAFHALVKRVFELANVSALPTVITAEPTVVSVSSATFNGGAGSSYMSATTSFTYGLQPGLDGETGTVVAQSVSGASTTVVSASVTSLIPGSTYYFRANATNLVGTTSGEIKSLRTLAATPLVTSGVASAISSDAATVSGDFNAQLSDTQAFFQYATVPDFSVLSGTVDAGTVGGSANATFASAITGLTPGQTYYWRAAASNSAGTTVGETRSLRAPIFRARNSLTTSGLTRRLAIDTTTFRQVVVAVTAKSSAVCSLLKSGASVKFLKNGKCRVKVTLIGASGKQVNFYNLAVR